jgi:hypothetical protein
MRSVHEASPAVFGVELFRKINRYYFGASEAASFLKRGSFRSGSNIGSSRSSAGVSGGSCPKSFRSTVSAPIRNEEDFSSKWIYWRRRFRYYPSSFKRYAVFYGASRFAGFARFQGACFTTATRAIVGSIIDAYGGTLPGENCGDGGACLWFACPRRMRTTPKPHHPP